MGDNYIVKIALTIICSLMLLWAQVVVAVPAANPVTHNCGCGGKMACCKKIPAPASEPPVAVASLVSQDQILSPVPATAVLTLTAVATASISPVISPSLTAGATPLFARHCVRLI